VNWIIQHWSVLELPNQTFIPISGLEITRTLNHINMKQFEIVFFNGEEYFSGETLTGQIVCNIELPMELKSIRMKLKGKGNVHWIDSHMFNNTTRTKEYSNSEVFFTSFQNFGTGERHKLAAGEHIYKFSFVLPDDLPSSFAEEYGQITYKATVTINIPLAMDMKCKKEFKIMNRFRFSDFPPDNTPTRIEKSKYLRCYCCKSGPITCRCWLPKRGYLPGETLSFSAEIENLSTLNMRGSELKLVQRISYHGNLIHSSHPSSFSSQSKRKVVSNTIWEDTRPGFEREDYWSDCRILIPRMYPSPFLGTSLFDIAYQLEFKVYPARCFTKLVAYFPILIGTERFVPNPNSNADPDTAHAIPASDCGKIATAIDSKEYSAPSSAPPSVPSLTNAITEQPPMGENPYATVVGTDSMGSVAPDVTNPASAPPNYEYRFVPPTDAASNPLGERSYAINTSVPYSYTPTVDNKEN